MENKFYRILFFLSILLIIISFDLAHNPPSGWQKQMLPNIGNRDVTDMCFVDSLNGFATISIDNDSAFILKTTNAGNNWFTSLIHDNNFFEIQFISDSIGYSLSINRIYKTTNQGNAWSIISLPFDLYPIDMYVLNEDTIWVTDTEASVGGVFLTTNGGGGWTRKYYAGGFANPDKIYFVNNKLGFAQRGINNYLRTTNFGDIWTIISQPFIWFNDMNFIDSLTGYKANGYIMKTTNGGLNWIQQLLPAQSDTISSNTVEKITGLLNNNTIYGVGPSAFYFTINKRGLIFKTTDGGNTWGYQLPDTSKIKFFKYSFTSFVDTNLGWAYQQINGGINTNTGGDTTIYTGIKNISTEVPKDFRLHQNFPNPFNPKTKIRYDVLKRTKIKLKIFDINGREVMELINQEHIPGTYEAEFDGTSLSSGIYFGILNTENFEDVIRMILIK